MKATAVPGSQLVVDRYGKPMTDKKHRNLWEMPRPIKVVLHKKRSFKGKGKTKVVMEEMVEVPVYRGADARLARNIKSQIRRAHRKEALRKAALVVEVPDNLMEDEDVPSIVET